MTFCFTVSEEGQEVASDEQSQTYRDSIVE